MVSAGVVDRNKKLIGMITADDILTVVKEEAEEDTFKLAGVQDEEITDNAFKLQKKIYLVINKLIYSCYCFMLLDCLTGI